MIQKDLKSLKKYNSKSKVIIQTEAVTDSDIFTPGVSKTSDGRTRRKRGIEGNASDVQDVAAGRELKN